jgi:guanylate kinase
LIKIQEYIDDIENTKLFVLSGPSGAGKSTLMANIAKKVTF